jgi:hypothetical protein
MYGKIIIITILLINTFCFGQISTNEDHTLNFYHELSLKEKINDTLKINDVIEWFKKEVSKITLIVEKKKQLICITYFFYETKQTGYLELYYDKENICKHIVLKLCVNGTPKLYEDDEAKRMMISFLSYNDEFEYHSID